MRASHPIGSDAGHPLDVPAGTRSGPPLLVGRHVRLEPLTLEHVAPLCEVGLDPDLWRWTISSVVREEDMRSYVQDALDASAAGTAIPFATVHLASGRVVGSTRFGNIDPPNRRVEIGWSWIAAPWRRTAVNTEAKFLMLAYAFDRMGCIRVELKTDALNQRSRAAITRLGAREEGTLRSHMIAHGGRARDTVYFSILREEWPGVRERLERRLHDHDADLAPRSGTTR